ncbi:MAG: UDP-N-acetylglucosamine pyrophosphorylase [Clostridia bacterium]|nr:UDP-N-acetylglucosamine pyrophosphorylase [Clostridia bacterium]
MIRYPIPELTAQTLFSLRHTLAAPLLTRVRYPWEALDGLKEYILAAGATLTTYEQPRPGVWIHPTATVAPTAFLGDAVILGPHAEIRHGAFIRGVAIVGEGAVVGNSTELKNAILFDGVQVPHYNYVGDSILGYMAHLGAGAVTSNVKSDRTPVSVRVGDIALSTGRKKLGALLGDRVEVGCNAVLNPGTVIGQGSRIYPLSSVRGYVPENTIYKKRGESAAIR